eukprot:1789482-Amphidinium_carterae.1
MAGNRLGSSGMCCSACVGARCKQTWCHTETARPRQAHPRAPCPKPTFGSFFRPNDPKKGRRTMLRIVPQRLSHTSPENNISNINKDAVMKFRTMQEQNAIALHISSPK